MIHIILAFGFISPLASAPGRHESFYGMDLLEVDEKEANDALKKAEQFLKSVRSITEKRNINIGKTANGKIK